ncbi:MAG: RHS repeat-associated core domain-containing protein, partial [Thiobacillaceae bacterium]
VSRKKTSASGESVFFFDPQTRTASRQNASCYDRIASGRSIYNYFRDYDPTTGRYVESDPLGMAAGTNPYTYVTGNPLSRTDPLGLCDKKKCKGLARVLKGNSDTLGKPGGWSGPTVGSVIVAPNSAAVITSQWGGKGALRPYIGSISGSSNGSSLFGSISEIIGGESPTPGLLVGPALMKLNPGDLIIELPSASKDQGIIPIELTIPNAIPCPQGTVEITN